MPVEFEFISPEDKPALLALNTPEFLAAVKPATIDLGYKVHTVASHEEFSSRFTQIQYQVVFIEETFCCSSITDNLTLHNVQTMPMNQRRHAVILLLGSSFQTLHPMQAYQMSVHAVVNPQELPSIVQIIQKCLADNNLFLHLYRDTQLRIAQGKT